MSEVSTEVEALFAKFVEAHVVRGEILQAADLCGGRPELLPTLELLIRKYLSLTRALDDDGDMLAVLAAPLTEARTLPQFEGFQTIERLGAGGMGEVFKLRDLRLDRFVAGKVLQRDARTAVLPDFLREARTLALFSDRRIVRLFEFRPDADPPVIIMEYVDGFELGRIGPSLEFSQRARIMLEVCDAIHHAHSLGLQHRDLKPGNIMLDAQLQPRILDFGLSGRDPLEGHLKGTVGYLAPEQLDRSRPIDARTDVYALGVILYELLCGRRPYDGSTDRKAIEAIRAGHPPLPVEIDPSVPEPLQAVALKAMERDPEQRYASARDLAADLQRFLDHHVVLARPTVYASTLASRVAPHMQQIAEWLRLRLVYPHEVERLHAAYRALEAREDDWIVESRALSYSQIALYLGAFLTLCGSLFYFAAARWYETVEGVVRPLAVLGLPFAGLNAAAVLLYRRDQRAVSVAFYLSAVALLPLLLIILFHEAGLLIVPPDTPGQLFQDGSTSNRQLQVTTLVASAWCGWLALRTRTAALSTVFTLLVLLFGMSALADFGLRSWFEDGRWDALGIHLLPLAAGCAALGIAAERTARPWMARPHFLAGAVVLMAALELVALDGRAFHHLGLSLQVYQPASVSNPLLLDTLAAMTLNGALFYALASFLDRRGSEVQRVAAQLMFLVSPFAMLQPLGYLVRTGEYSGRYDWIYLALAVITALLSQVRQRRAFYYAGVLNTGAALFLLADHREWFDKPAWGVAVIGAGLVALIAGFELDRRQRRRRRI